MDEQNDADVNQDKRNRVQKCGDTARGFLELGEQRILADKFFCFGVFTAERAYDTCAVQIFTRGVQNGIQLVLNSLVALDGQQHDAEYHNGEQSDHNEEQQRAAGINGERHNACAEHNERRAHKQAQYKVHTVLHLIYVICDACQQRGSAHTVQKREGEFVDFLEQAVTQPGGKAHGSLCGKILRRDGTDHADHTEPDQKQTAGDDEAGVAGLNAHVDDLRDYERDNQLKGGFEQLEKRR